MKRKNYKKIFVFEAKNYFYIEMLCNSIPV